MDVFRGVVLLFWLGQFVVQGCGTLKASSIYKDNVSIGRLRLYPDDNWLKYIEEKKYRWLKGKPYDKYVGYYTNGVFASSDPRITEEANYMLVINEMVPSDEDEYQLECLTSLGPQSGRNTTAYVRLTLPSEVTNGSDSTTQQTTTTPATIPTRVVPGTPGQAVEKPAEDNTTTTAVVSVMIVVIVVLVIVIISLIISNKVKSRKRQQDRKAIAPDEETQKSEDNDRQEENIYCEINDPEITYAKVIDTPMLHSQVNLAFGTSNGPTSRDQDKLLTSQSLDKEFPESSSSLQQLYSKVIPKVLRGKKTSELADTIEPDRQKVAGVSKGGDQGIIRKPQRSTIKKNGCQYNSMDCILSPSASDEGHEYANTTSSTLPRSFRRKGSKSTTDLTYIELDHGEDRYAEIEPQVLGKAPSSEYVSIDFEKKAFVAPLRKAPSSWYRKRKERKEKKKQQK